MGTGSFPGVKYGRGVLLITQHLLVPRSWKSRAIPLPTLWATLRPVTETFTFTFVFYYYYFVRLDYTLIELLFGSLRVFENRVLRRIFGSKGEDVRGDWRKLHN